MKRTVSLVLTAACLLSLFLPVHAAELNAAQQEELLSLGIMTGDENGDLRLKHTITRAEALKMLCVAGGLYTENTAAGAFADVTDSHWAYQYICAAKECGIVDGDEKGNFNPDGDVTNEEFIKMLVCLLGYGAMAEFRGGYPAGYTAIAAQRGITKDMQLAVNEPALRNDAGAMLCNALDIPLMAEKRNCGGSDAVEYIIMDGTAGTAYVTLRSAGAATYDTTRDVIDRFSKAFASQYEYHEGDTEKSFALYPDIIYTSGLEKTADGRVYECPAIYDDAMAQALLSDAQRGQVQLVFDGQEAQTIPYVIFNSHMLVPARVFQRAGCEVQFDETTYVTTIRTDDVVLEILPNLIGMRKNQAEGFWVPLAVCARWIGNQLFVPIEAVAYEFGLTATCNQETNTVTVQ